MTFESRSRNDDSEYNNKVDTIVRDLNSDTESHREHKRKRESPDEEPGEHLGNEFPHEYLDVVEVFWQTQLNNESGCVQCVQFTDLLLDLRRQNDRLLREINGLKERIDLLGREKENILQALLKNESGRPTCIICFEKEVSHAIVSCFHTVLCETCAVKVAVCPICRKVKEGIERIFLGGDES